MEWRDGGGGELKARGINILYCSSRLPIYNPLSSPRGKLRVTPPISRVPFEKKTPRRKVATIGVSFLDSTHSVPLAVFEREWGRVEGKAGREVTADGSSKNKEGLLLIPISRRRKGPSVAKVNRKATKGDGGSLVKQKHEGRPRPRHKVSAA